MTIFKSFWTLRKRKIGDSFEYKCTADMEINMANTLELHAGKSAFKMDVVEHSDKHWEATDTDNGTTFEVFMQDERPVVPEPDKTCFVDFRDTELREIARKELAAKISAEKSGLKPVSPFLKFK